MDFFEAVYCSVKSQHDHMLLYMGVSRVINHPFLTFPILRNHYMSRRFRTLYNPPESFFSPAQFAVATPFSQFFYHVVLCSLLFVVGGGSSPPLEHFCYRRKTWLPCTARLSLALIQADYHVLCITYLEYNLASIAYRSPNEPIFDTVRSRSMSSNQAIPVNDHSQTSCGLQRYFHGHLG